MSTVRYLAYENKLAKLIKAPGGKTVEAAVEDAETGLRAIAAACLIDIDRMIEILNDRAGDLVKPAGKDDPLYTSAREIAGLAAICRRPALGQAAHSLCVLIDLSEADGRWHREAVMVHISTIQLLRGMQEGGEDAIHSQLVASLQDMVTRLADEDRRPAAST
jgi:hypothetical protein